MNPDRTFTRPGGLARKHEITEPVPQQPAQIYAEQLAELGATIGDLRNAIQALVPVVLSSETVILDAFGTATKQYRVPFRSIAITSYSAASLTIAPSPLGPGAPPSGPGVAVVGARSFRVCNMSGYAWSLYGGAPGDVVTIETYARPQPPNTGPALAAAVTAAGQLDVVAVPFGTPSVAVSGANTAPGAGANISGTIAAPPAGIYQVTCQVYLDGTIVAGTDDDNMKINVSGGGPATHLLVPGVAGVISTTIFIVSFNGAQTVNILCNNAASASATYHAAIQAWRIA